ncbi:hypothetical protein LUZ61_014705 [Rhynchospora tenuis]|uniref:Uncharacterized protein n=1 Tax=Rhynchospora tenuis TaxID=198213 RepID=A0AAD5WB82_9POAL|nr:hypothetical protein LUZ61_014705 [Rhynchospora tenuis]
MSEIRGVVNPRNLDFEFAMADSTSNTQIAVSASKAHATQHSQLGMPGIEALTSSLNVDQIMSDPRSTQAPLHTQLGMPTMEAFPSSLSRDPVTPDPRLAKGGLVQQPRVSGIPDPSGSDPPPITQVGELSGIPATRSNPTQVPSADQTANTSTVPPSGVASSTPTPPFVESVAQPSSQPIQQPRASIANVTTSQIPIPQSTSSGHTQTGQYPYNSSSRDAETRYPPVEKAAFAVMIASRKLKPYFQAHPIKVLTELPLRRALGQLDVAGRLLKWAVELSEYDVTFIPRTAYKSQILADFVVECTARSSELSSKDEVWNVYVDGAASERGSGVRVEIIGPKGEKFHYAIHLTFNVSNNVAEYEALLAGLRLTEATGAKKVKIHTDSQLVVNQISGEYATTNEKLILYLEKVKAIIATFEMASVEYVPRTQNETADALSKLAKESDLDRDKPIVMLEIPSPSIDVLELGVYVTEVRDEWYTLLWDFLSHDKLPEDDKIARKVKRWALEFTIMDGNLLKKGYGIPWLTCVGRTKADELISEIHEGICGSHQGMKSLINRIIRAGFYWPTLRRDVEEFIRRCEKCQLHSRIPRQPPHAMQSIASPWPFDVWGIDLLGPFPQGQGNVKFLVVAVEYFTKWIEAKPLATISSQKVVDFVRHQIVYRYGLPHTIISDNGTQFSGTPFQDFCKGLGIRSFTSSVCHPQSNGLAEVSNRTILEGLKKKIEGSKNTWPEYLDEILWAYRTTPRTATGRSPFAMVYGMEAVTPMEIVHPSLRTISYEWSSNGIRREQELTMIHELREEAKVKAEDYQRKMRKNFDKRVAPKHFQPGDWVLRKVEATGKPVGKLDPVWEGPFEVTKSIEGRAYHLQDMQGKKIPNAWNAAHLRKFYV